MATIKQVMGSIRDALESVKHNHTWFLFKWLSQSLRMHTFRWQKKKEEKTVSGCAGSYPEAVPGSGMCSVLIVMAVRVEARVRAVSLSSQQMRPNGDREERSGREGKGGKGAEVTDRTCDPVVATPAVSPPLPPNHRYLSRPHPANWPMLLCVHTHTHRQMLYVEPAKEPWKG